MNLTALKRSPRSFRMLCGLSPSEFDALFTRFAPRYDAYRRRAYARARKKRPYGTGRRPA